MRFVLKLLAVMVVTVCAQVGYELAWSMHAYPTNVYGTNTIQVDQAIATEHHLNSCNLVTRRIMECVLSIPLPGEAS
ncbi:MAG: hypothetical protein JWM57_3667 [Phycisphaerales bacterium]|nr:hypothetical protein [Phycisphaerales bacterium]